ncbi:hypothetical protein STENM327S_08100 [Streptomyces tendae]
MLGLAEAVGEAGHGHVRLGGSGPRNGRCWSPRPRWRSGSTGRRPFYATPDRAPAEEPELAHRGVRPPPASRRRVGGRTAVARDGVVVAVLLDPDEAHWLEERARNVRQGFMDPKQRAAFEDFLARQAGRGERSPSGYRSPSTNACQAPAPTVTTGPDGSLLPRALPAPAGLGTGGGRRRLPRAAGSGAARRAGRGRARTADRRRGDRPVGRHAVPGRARQDGVVRVRRHSGRGRPPGGRSRPGAWWGQAGRREVRPPRAPAPSPWPGRRRRRPGRRRPSDPRP